MTSALPDRIVLTGPGGWIGQAMLAHLAGAGVRLAERVTAFGSAAGTLTLPSGEALNVRALSSIGREDVAGAHVVHLAYLTKEKAETLGERRFTCDNLAIDDMLLSALDGAGAGNVAGLFVASSGAAALAAAGHDTHPYGLGKLRQEARFLAWGQAARVPVLSGRIFNVAGPYANKLESYALSNFIEQGRTTGCIAIKAAVPVFRSFLHIDDLCRLVLGALGALGALGTGAMRSRPVDLCGAEIVEMGDLAALVSEVVGAALGRDVPLTRGAIDYGRPSVYLGQFVDTRVLAMELGIELKGLREQIADAFGWLARKQDAPEGTMHARLADLGRAHAET